MIKTSVSGWKSSFRPSGSRYFFPGLTLAIGLPLVFFIGSYQLSHNETAAKAAFEHRAQQAIDTIAHRMHDHAQILLAGAGLFEASLSVERGEWRAFIERQDIPRNHPGIQGVGFSKIVHPGDLQAHIAAVRAEGFPDYTVRPAEERPLYTSIVYLEPFSGRNLAAFGYDMMSEPTRAAAMHQAAITGFPTISGKVTLVQETEGPVQAGFLMYLPIYRKGQPLNSADDRWRALDGFVYSPYRMKDLMDGILGGRNLDVGFDIYDGSTADEAGKMFASETRPPDAARFTAIRTLAAYGHAWTIRLYSQPQFVENIRLGGGQDILILVFGSLIVLLIAGLMFALNLKRLRAEGLVGDLRGENRAIVDTVVDGIVTIDPAGTVLTFNPAAQRIFGYGAAEVIGNNVKMLMPEPYRGQHDGYLSHYLTTGEAKVIGIGREVTGRRKDGRQFPMDLAISEMSVTGRRMFTGIVRDITERKALETAQLEINATLERSVAERTAELDFQRREKELFLNSVGDGLYGLNTEGRVTFINPAGARILGYSIDELLGQPMHAKCHHTHADGQSHPLGDCPIHACMKDGLVRTIANDVMWRKNGAMVPIEYTCTPIRDQEQKVAGVMVVFRDVTERQSLQAQLAQAQKMEAVGQLTGGVAHDFNNLLGVIVGNLDLAETMTAAASETRPFIRAALDGALRGSELIKQLLAFSRSQILSPTVLDANESLDKMRDLIARASGETVALKFALATDLWPTKVDPAQFESAILNLAINARDAMPKGGVLTVETCNASLDNDYLALHPDVAVGDYVCISVNDTGIGMPPEVVARVFEPFFTTKEQGKGTGLGLSMVYGFVKQSGGHVAVYSEVGHGTSVKIYLPRVQPSDRRGAGANSPDSDLPRGTESILMVEDNPGMSAIAQRQLRSLGYRVRTVETAADALALLETGDRFDLLFSDIVMPGGMTGLELADEASARWPGIKILLTSGFHGETAKGHDIDRPVLTKPYRIADLARTVRAILDGSGRPS